MEVVFDRGVYLPEMDLWLDSLRKKESGFISHAHSDHTARHQRPALTPNTLRLLAGYLERSDPIPLPYNEPLEQDGYSITLYPAGHCLGSAQALIESRKTGERLLYTGDIKIQPSPTNEPLEPVPCDVLVLESTYGKPGYSFPPQEEVLATAYKTLSLWLSRGEKPVIRVWRLGKAQEVLHHLLSNGFDVMLEETIYAITGIYRDAGVEFPGEYHLFDGDLPEGMVLLCPPSRAKNSRLGNIRGKRIMELTGWAAGDDHWWGRADASLPFSDHPGFNELVSYVLQVRPKQVYTVNGFPDLAAHLRDMGIPAVHLDGKAGSKGGANQNGAGFQMKLV
ncbi:MAG: hypothetical protein BZY88_16920 [SAR202 cluster bacterium Io17-Chloro-G9]|nr:MAG: hypothetical protein BZY88_16920 [SAR202 cluster bacterium Io17-Chloro-G9]